MSDAELERAACTPSQWVAIKSSNDRGDHGCLPIRATQIIEDPNHPIHPQLEHLYLVPGGCYFVASSVIIYLGVWDLGYVPDSDKSSKPTNMWTTIINGSENFLVHPTPDGLGTQILA